MKTSDHRPVSALFDIDVEICDETKLHQEFIGIHVGFIPSNAQIAAEIKLDSTNARRNQLLEELDFYVKKNYGTETLMIDRL